MIVNFIKYNISLFSTKEDLVNLRTEAISKVSVDKAIEKLQAKNFFDQLSNELDEYPNFIHHIQSIDDLIKCLNHFPHDGYELLIQLDLTKRNNVNKKREEFVAALTRTGILSYLTAGKQVTLLCMALIALQHAKKLVTSAEKSIIAELFLNENDLLIHLQRINNPALALELIFILTKNNYKMPTSLPKTNLMEKASTLSTYFVEGKETHLGLLLNQETAEKHLNFIAIADEYYDFIDAFLEQIPEEKVADQVIEKVTEEFTVQDKFLMLMIALKSIYSNNEGFIDYKNRYQEHLRYEKQSQIIVSLLEPLMQIEDATGKPILLPLMQEKMPFVLKVILSNIYPQISLQIMTEKERDFLHLPKTAEITNKSNKLSAQNEITDGSEKAACIEKDINIAPINLSDISGDRAFYDTRPFPPSKKNINEMIVFIDLFLQEHINKYLNTTISANEPSNLQFDYLCALVLMLKNIKDMDECEKLNALHGLFHFLQYLCRIEKSSYAKYALVLTKALDTISPWSFTCTNMYQEFTNSITKDLDLNFAINEETFTKFYHLLKYRMPPLYIIHTLELGKNPLSSQTCKTSVKDKYDETRMFFNNACKSTNNWISSLTRK